MARTIVIGLGNPGPSYAATRHNIGFRVVDRIAEERGLGWRKLGWFRSTAWIAADPALILVKPRTFMNRSGLAARAACRRYRVEPSRLVAVYDDADLELGRLRLRKSGGSGGHNGVRSLSNELQGEVFPRLRLGVRGTGRTGADLAEYLLSPFDESEHETVERLVALAVDAVEAVVDGGLESAMNRYNRLGRADLPAVEN